MMQNRVDKLVEANPQLLRPDLLADPNFLEAIEEARRFFEAEGAGE